MMHAPAAQGQERDAAAALGGVPGARAAGLYRYSRFCELYQWRKRIDVTMRQVHRAGPALPARLTCRYVRKLTQGLRSENLWPQCLRM